ncbi:MAG: hypothetical protein AAFV80_23385, partial [Bacteroidota bacterium]
MFISKLLIALLIVVALLLLLALLGRKSVHHEVSIQASPEQVWTTIFQTSEYDNWNPVMKLLEGEVQEGNQVTYQFTQDAEKSYPIPTKVKQIIPNQLLHQGGGMVGVLTFNHQYRLEATEDYTRLIIHEDYRGIGIHFWNPTKV